MEEDINIIEEMLILNKNRIEPQIEQAVKNLINKNKELRQEVAEYERRETQQNKNMVSALEESFKYSLEIKDLEIKNKELEKMVDLMAKDIAKNDIDEDICRKVKNKTSEKDDCYGDDYDMCKDCVIEFYSKKASDNDEQSR